MARAKEPRLKEEPDVKWLSGWVSPDCNCSMKADSPAAITEFDAQRTGQSPQPENMGDGRELRSVGEAAAVTLQCRFSGLAGCTANCSLKGLTETGREVLPAPRR